MPSPDPRAQTLRGGMCALFGLALLASCGATGGDVVPSELKERLPTLSRLLPASLPGAAGPAQSPSREAHSFVGELRGMLRQLDVLGEYLDEGGARDDTIALVIALVTPPHVADLAVRYSRDGSRLDVERFGDHAFYYLQLPRGGSFQLDSQIDESGMLLDGGSATPPYATRPVVTTSTGRAKATSGYLRLQYNRRGEDVNPVHSAVQIDYRLEQPVPDTETTRDTIIYSFFRGDRVALVNGQLRGVLVERRADGGALLVSESRGNGVAWRWRAAYTAAGALKVWGSDGALAACYDASGVELGNKELPEPCDAIEAPLPAVPKVPGVLP